jgi:hypothetical protein
MRKTSPTIVLNVLAACLLCPAPAIGQVTAATVMRWTGLPITGPDAPQAPQPSDLPAHQAVPRAAAGGYAVDTSSREAVRLLYKTVFASSNEVAASWTGNVTACDAGATSSAYQEATLRRINWFRAMAGVPANVTFDATFNQKAQQAALMISANRQLSHTPTADWLCYSALGAEAAGKSNIGIGQAGPQAIAEGYLRDPGSNNAAVGHRRWMLYPQTQVMGIGNVVPPDGLAASAVWVQDGRFGTARPTVRDDFVAWPPKGFVPYSTVYPRWSFSYPGADFSGSSVTMTENGAPMATRRETPANGYGENTLVWFPGSYVDDMKWAKPNADTTYAVTVNNVRLNGQARSFNYNVTVIDPDVAGTDTPNLTPQGSASLATGQSGIYTFGTSPGNASYQWRTLTLAAYTFADGAESGGNNFTFGTSSGYAAITSDAAASGSQSFHLAHLRGVDQTMLLNTTVVPSASGSLTFASRLGLSSPQQVALAEVSSDDGLTWSTVFQQAGVQSGSTSNFGESRFSPKSVSLGAFANKTLRVRFRYSYLGGSFYPQTSAGIGWYIDDIALSGMESVADSTATTDLSSTSFTYTPAQSGAALLQVRAGLFGHFAEWSTGLKVNVSADASTSAGQVASGADCLFNWAERTVPSLLNPPASSRTVASYTFRFYSGTTAYLAVRSTDMHLLYVAGGPVMDLGHQSIWLTQAGCQ